MGLLYPLANNIKRNLTKRQDLRVVNHHLPVQLHLHNFIGVCSIDVKIKKYCHYKNNNRREELLLPLEGHKT